MADRTLRARFEADTGDFSTRLAAAQMQLERMERAPVAAARGMRQLEGSLRSLAAEAAGGLGPLGRAAGAVTGLFSPGLKTLAITAAMAGFVKITLDAQAAVEKLIDNNEKLVSQAAGMAGPLAAAMGQIADTGAAMDQPGGGTGLWHWLQTRGLFGLSARGEAEAQTESTRQATLQLILDLQLRKMHDIRQETADRIKLETGELTTLEQALQLGEQRYEAEKKARAEMEKSLRAMKPLMVGPGTEQPLRGGLAVTAALQNMGVGTVGNLPSIPTSQTPTLAGVQGPVTTAIEAQVAAMDQQKAMVDGLTAALQSGNLTAAQAAAAQLLLKQATEQTAKATELAALKTQQAVASMIMGVGTMVQGLIGGGGAGGFFGGLLGVVGGIVGAGNPILGAALMAGGGIISSIAAKSQREERSVTVADFGNSARQALKDAQPKRPVIVNTYIVDQFGRTVRQLQEQQDEQSRFDAVVRFGAGTAIPVGT